VEDGERSAIVVRQHNVHHEVNSACPKMGMPKELLHVIVCHTVIPPVAATHADFSTIYALLTVADPHCEHYCANELKSAHFCGIECCKQ
jgi:hypothetical protein